MMTLTVSVLWAVIKSIFFPAVLIWIQVKLSKKKQLRWSVAFIGMIAVILVANYFFLTNTASVGQLKKMSSNLSDGNRAEMYVRENDEKEIIAYSTLKIINCDGVIIDEEESQRYESVISELVGNRSLADSVWEEEEILANPKNVIFKYQGGVYTISAGTLLKHTITVILALVLISGVTRFLLKKCLQKKRVSALLKMRK